METELYPVKITTQSSTNLYFHNKKDDNLYVLKNAFKQSKLRMFGTFRILHLDESELIQKGTLTDQRKLHTLFIIEYLPGYEN